MNLLILLGIRKTRLNCSQVPPL